MKRFAAIAVALVVALAACGEGSVEAPDLSSSTTSTTSVDQITAAPSTNPPESTTSTEAPTTTAPPAAEALEIPRLDDGLPATFLAITTDWEAVEVDTATGEIVRSLGQVQDPVETEDDGMVDSALTAAWRTSDHEWFVVAECCEPAAGTIYKLRPGESVTRDNQVDRHFAYAWNAAPSPFDDRLALAGFQVEVTTVDGPPTLTVDVDPFWQVSGTPAWGRTGETIAWISNSFTEDSEVRLFAVDLGGADPIPSETVLSWVGPEQWLDGLGTQASGNHVAFLHTRDPDPERSDIVATEGVVFSSTGELVAMFDVEKGSRWGSYEPSGRMLIYTDGDNVVRWQGLGDSGVLGEGYLHASW